MKKIRKKNHWSVASKKFIEMDCQDLYDLSLKCLGEIKRNLDESIAITYLLKDSFGNPSFSQRYDNSYAGNAYNVIVKSLIQSNVMAVSRIWDEDNDTNSLINLSRILSMPRMENFIIEKKLDTCTEKFRNFINQDSQMYSDNVVDQIYLQRKAIIIENMRMIIEIISNVEAVCNSDIFESLNVARSKLFAHSLDFTFSEKKAIEQGRVIGDFFIGDEVFITKSTIKIVKNIYLILADKHYEEKNIKIKWERYSKEFWEGMEDPQSSSSKN